MNEFNYFGCRTSVYSEVFTQNDDNTKLKTRNKNKKMYIDRWFEMKITIV